MDDPNIPNQHLSIPTKNDLDLMLDKCQSLCDHSLIRESRIRFMQQAIDSFQHATVLLGYFSQLQNFTNEMCQLNQKLTKHRNQILNRYIDLLSQTTIKQLSIPSANTKSYQKGIYKFNRARNYILYHYNQKLYRELEVEPYQINAIRKIVNTIVKLDKHYNIYEELIAQLQKKNKAFDKIMTNHLNEFIYI